MKKIVDFEFIQLSKIEQMNKLIADGYEVIGTTVEVCGAYDNVSSRALVTMIKYEPDDKAIDDQKLKDAAFTMVCNHLEALMDKRQSLKGCESNSTDMLKELRRGEKKITKDFAMLDDPEHKGYQYDFNHFRELLKERLEPCWCVEAYPKGQECHECYLCRIREEAIDDQNVKEHQETRPCKCGPVDDLCKCGLNKVEFGNWTFCTVCDTNKGEDK